MGAVVEIWFEYLIPFLLKDSHIVHWKLNHPIRNNGLHHGLGQGHERIWSSCIGALKTNSIWLRWIAQWVAGGRKHEAVPPNPEPLPPLPLLFLAIAITSCHCNPDVFCHIVGYPTKLSLLRVSQKKTWFQNSLE